MDRLEEAYTRGLKHDGDISSLTVQLTRLATIVENSEKQRLEDNGAFKNALIDIRQISDNMSKVLVLQTEFGTLKDLTAELKNLVKNHDHSIGTLKNANLMLPDLKERIIANSNKIDHVAEKSLDFLPKATIEAKISEIKTMVHGLEDKQASEIKRIDETMQSLISLRDKAFGGAFVARGGAKLIHWLFGGIIGAVIYALFQLAFAPHETTVKGKIYTEKSEPKATAKDDGGDK